MQLEESKEKEEKDKEKEKRRRRRRWRGKKDEEEESSKGQRQGGRQGGREEKQTSYINWMTDSYETRRKIILCIGSKQFPLFMSIVSILKLKKKKIKYF